MKINSLPGIFYFLLIAANFAVYSFEELVEMNFTHLSAILAKIQTDSRNIGVPTKRKFCGERRSRRIKSEVLNYLKQAKNEAEL